MTDPERIQETLRVLAETQRALVAGGGGSGRSKRAQSLLQEYSSVGAAKQYKLWKRSVCLLNCLHDVSDSELALLIVAQVKGTATDALDIIETNDTMGARAHGTDWRETQRGQRKLGLSPKTVGATINFEKVATCLDICCWSRA